ncbi:hypothetical protein Dimus_031753 [Dionaea muscipula]
MEDDGQKKKQKEHELKHLGFVRMAVIQTIVFVWAVYEYAKQNSGSWKPTIQRVEVAVVAAMSPVYDKFKDVPDNLLLFLDGKVDVAAREFDVHAPPLAKHVVVQVQALTLKALEIAKELLERAQNDGPRETAIYAATESKQLVLAQTVRVYSKLDQLPPFHKLAQVAVPLAAFSSAKYNTVISNASRRYPLFSYAPLIPVDGIAKAFKQSEAIKQANNGAVLPANGAEY